jgi:hypothetical protein
MQFLRKFFTQTRVRIEVIFSLFLVSGIKVLEEHCLHIMLRDLLTQLTSHSKTVTGFRCPRACRIRKYQFENR